MKYEQPYGVSDPNAPYINGNPTTGTMGSIPPAASIENPQREIVNFETDSGLTPTDADLHQLSKSVQSGKVNYAQDAGTPNFIAITPVPAIPAYQIGQYFRIKAANTNTGATQLNVNGIGWAPVVHGDGSPLSAFEINANQIIEVAWDGNGHWQMLTGGNGGTVLMTAPRSFYVNGTTGSDTNYDGTASTISGVHGPFKTIQHALQVMTTYNLGGYNFYIYVADGTYALTSSLILPIPNGSGQVLLIGNTSVPNAVELLNTGTGSTITVLGGSYSIDGFYIHNTLAGGGDPGHGIWSSGISNVFTYHIAFAFCVGSHFYCGPGGFLGVAGPVRIYGGGSSHMAAGMNGTISFPPQFPALTIMNPNLAFGGFAVASNGGQVAAYYSSINYNAGASVTGLRYSAYGNGVIDTRGSGATYLPGDAPGATATGGQYL